MMRMVGADHTPILLVPILREQCFLPIMWAGFICYYLLNRREKQGG